MQPFDKTFLRVNRNKVELQSAEGIEIFREGPKCFICWKDIKGDEVVYVKMRYPTYKGITEMRAYLKNEGSFIWKDYFNKQSSSLIGK